MMKYHRATIIVPADYTGPLDPSACHRYIRDYLMRVLAAWLKGELGVTFATSTKLWRSPMTWEQLATLNPITGKMIDGWTPEGEGFSIARVEEETLRAWGLRPGGASNPSYRFTTFVLRGGGVAAGLWKERVSRLWGTRTYGMVWLGDWGLHYATTGQPAPGLQRLIASNPAFLGYETRDPQLDTGHELAHAWGLIPLPLGHQPYVLGGQPLSERDAMLLRERSREFLR